MSENFNFHFSVKYLSRETGENIFLLVESIYLFSKTRRSHVNYFEPLVDHREKWAETRGGEATIKTLRNACSAGIERKSGSLEFAPSQRNVSLRMESLTTSFSTSLSLLLSLYPPRIPVTAHETPTSRRAPPQQPSRPPKDESTCRMRRGASSSVIKTLLSLYAPRSKKRASQRRRAREGEKKSEGREGIQTLPAIRARRGEKGRDVHLDLSAGRLCNYFPVPVYCTRGQDRVPVLSAPFRLP